MATAGKQCDARCHDKKCFHQRQREIALARTSKERFIFLLILTKGVIGVEMARKLHFGKLTRTVFDRFGE